MLASPPHGWPASKSAAALSRISCAASVEMCEREIANCTPWLAPMGRPKITRWFEYATAFSMNQRASPSESEATRMRSAFIPSRM